MRGLLLRRPYNKSFEGITGGLKLTGEQIPFLSDQLSRFGTFGLNSKIKPRSCDSHADSNLAQTLGIELHLHGLDPRHGVKQTGHAKAIGRGARLNGCRTGILRVRANPNGNQFANLLGGRKSIGRREGGLLMDN